MAAVTYDGDTPGRGGTRQLWAQGGRPMKVVTGYFTFDSSYPTGGEDITDIANQFKGIGTTTGMLGIQFTPTTSHIFSADQTAGAEKVLAYVRSTGAQVGNGIDISTVVPKFFAWGYIK